MILTLIGTLFALLGLSLLIFDLKNQARKKKPQKSYTQTLGRGRRADVSLLQYLYTACIAAAICFLFVGIGQLI